MVQERIISVQKAIQAQAANQKKHGLGHVLEVVQSQVTRQKSQEANFREKLGLPKKMKPEATTTANYSK